MKARDPKRFNVGDVVYRFERRGRGSTEAVEQEVLKVGRTLVYVGPPGETDIKNYRVGVFRIETGSENYPKGGYMPSGYVRTLSERAEDEREHAASERLRGLGVRIERYRGSGSLTLNPDTIHAICDLIEQDPNHDR